MRAAYGNQNADAMGRRTFLQFLVNVQESLLKCFSVVSLLEFVLRQQGVVQIAAAVLSDCCACVTSSKERDLVRSV